MQVLVLDDDFLIATCLADDLRSLGADVVGPFGSVEEAVEHADAASAAIVDVRIGNGTSTALADCLLGRRVPFVYYTGAATEIAGRHRGIRCFEKPASAREMLQALTQEQARRRATEPEVDVVELVPELRARARQLLLGPAAADRLVEAALLAAIDLANGRPAGTDTRTWLLNLLYDEHARLGRNLLD